jgi:hypothetical protein
MVPPPSAMMGNTRPSHTRGFPAFERKFSLSRWGCLSSGSPNAINRSTTKWRDSDLKGKNHNRSTTHDLFGVQDRNPRKGEDSPSTAVKRSPSFKLRGVRYGVGAYLLVTLRTKSPIWLPAGSEKTAHEPTWGISVLGSTVFPPCASTSASDASMSSVAR